VSEITSFEMDSSRSRKLFLLCFPTFVLDEPFARLVLRRFADWHKLFLTGKNFFHFF